MNHIVLIILLLISFPLLSQNQETYIAGEITPMLSCLEDSTQHYALFLPSDYSEKNEWPLILFFEPGARAMLPLEIYSDYADRFGYILACSYNSRNGPNQPIFDAANAMYNDVSSRFAVDEDRISLAGFSGGARISCLIALTNSKIKEVIGAGAGFPFSDPPEQKITFDYLGIIGTQDMNFQEMVMLDSILDTYSDNHVLVQFPKGHQWPDQHTFLKAFYWLETTSMRKGSIPIENSLVEEIRMDFEKQLDIAEKENKLIDQKLILKNLILLLNGLTNNEEYQERLNKLLASEAYQHAYWKSMSIRKQELALQKKYIDEFEQISLLSIYPEHEIKSENWWKKEFETINSMENRDMVLRLNEFLINGSWEQHFNSMRQKKYDAAIAYLQIFSAGQPEEPSSYYLLAIANASAGNSSEMYRYLNKAIGKGLINPELLTGEAAFSPYQGQKKFQKIVAGLSGG